MNVVDNCKSTILLRLVHHTNGVGLTAIYVAGADITTGNGVMTAVVHALLIDAVAIALTRFQASDTHVMHVRYNVTAHKILVIAGALHGVEVRAIVGRNLNPTHTAVGRCPHYGHLGLSNTHNPRTTLGLNARRIGSKGRSRCNDKHNAQKYLLHSQ